MENKDVRRKDGPGMNRVCSDVQTGRRRRRCREEAIGGTNAVSTSGDFRCFTHLYSLTYTSLLSPMVCVCVCVFVCVCVCERE
jgi:hypothetical protein